MIRGASVQCEASGTKVARAEIFLKGQSTCEQAKCPRCNREVRVLMSRQIKIRHWSLASHLRARAES